MIWTIVVLAVLVLVLLGFWVSWRASRLDRLHNRVESASTALDLALVRRSSAAADLASSGMIDPATSLLLADAVRRARQADPSERDLAESDLTRALRATLGEPGLREELAENEGATELVSEVEAASHQVYLARKFYNDLAGRTLDDRRRPQARVLHLSGTALPPEFFDIEDAPTGADRAADPPAGYGFYVVSVTQGGHIRCK